VLLAVVPLSLLSFRRSIAPACAAASGYLSLASLADFVLSEILISDGQQHAAASQVRFSGSSKFQASDASTAAA
jgi:hypothetical protein